jgi:hypothetical protein
VGSGATSVITAVSVPKDVPVSIKLHESERHFLDRLAHDVHMPSESSLLREQVLEGAFRFPRRTPHVHHALAGMRLAYTITFKVAAALCIPRGIHLPTSRDVDRKGN